MYDVRNEERSFKAGNLWHRNTAAAGCRVCFIDEDGPHKAEVRPRSIPAEIKNKGESTSISTDFDMQSIRWPLVTEAVGG